MKSVGVVVEYNPFHNGHLFHLEESKKVAQADIVIAAMSGNFLQRGEPALVSKWTRAKMALQAGVDLIFELPYQYATQQAETFAYGAVSILSNVGCDSICFGSESGGIDAFENTYLLMQNNETFFHSRVKEHIASGVSYPKALSLAFGDLPNSEISIDLSKPNNILGFQYLKAAKKQPNPLKVFTVERKSADYHDENFTSETVASATSIRNALFSKDQQLEKIKPFLPQSTMDLLIEYKLKYGDFHHWELYWPLLKFRLLQSSPEELRNLYEIEEGIENRLLSQVLYADSFSDFMNRIKTKRYTWTRLQRICLHVLMNAKKTEMKVSVDGVPYLRLLGMTEKGRAYLNQHKHQFSIPLISKLSAFKGKEVELDIRASRIYSCVNNHSTQNLLMKEFNEKPIYIQN